MQSRETGRRRPGRALTGIANRIRSRVQRQPPRQIGGPFRSASAARACCLCILACVTGCAQPPHVRFHTPDEYPDRLSAWGVVQKQGDRLVLGDRVTVYDINTPLFSDYALKLRTLWMPAGTSAEFAARDSFAMPAGTIISKTFFYPLNGGIAQAAAGWDGNVGELDLNRTRVIETRLLVKQASGWEALPYVWRGDDARLSLTGDLQNFALESAAGTVSLNYIVPTRNDCATCHATGRSGELQTIGIKTRHLNRGYHGGPANQLAEWQWQGLLRGAPAAHTWGAQRGLAPGRRIGGTPRPLLSRRQLRPLPQPGKRHRHLRAVARLSGPPAAPHGSLQTAHRRRPGNRRPPLVHRARRTRRLDTDLPHGDHRPGHAHARTRPHACAYRGRGYRQRMGCIARRRVRLRKKPGTAILRYPRSHSGDGERPDRDGRTLRPGARGRLWCAR